MTDAPDNGGVTPPEAALASIALPGQPDTDRGYTMLDGTKIRVRIVKGAEHATEAPTNTSVKLAPSGVSLLCSIALLDDQLKVQKDGAGRLMITDAVELVIGPEAGGNPSFDPQAEVEAWVRRRAAVMQTALAARTALASYLDANWGGAPLFDSAATPTPHQAALPAEAVAA